MIKEKRIATIKDVAARAGVSVGTVSRVLANEVSVKQPLRDRVTLAMSALNYKVNFAARALRTNHIDVIGLVVPDITNPFFAQLAKSIERQAALRGYSVMLANSHGNSHSEQNHISTLLDRSVRGIVVIAASDTTTFALETDVPIVSLDRRFAAFPLVATDHRIGSAMVADHLYQLGHRRVAYLAGPQNTEVGRMRKEGFVTRIQELSERGDTIHLDILEGQFDYPSGEAIGRKILTVAEHQRPTFIAAASDQLAIGALRCARDLKLKVPEDVSVAGFDDIALADIVVPRLTTIQQPTDVLAQKAIHIVFSEGALDESQAPIYGKLVIRGSTSVPPQLVNN